MRFKFAIRVYCGGHLDVHDDILNTKDDVCFEVFIHVWLRKEIASCINHLLNCKIVIFWLRCNRCWEIVACGCRGCSQNGARDSMKAVFVTALCRVSDLLARIEEFLSRQLANETLSGSAEKIRLDLLTPLRALNLPPALPRRDNGQCCLRTAKIGMTALIMFCIG